MDIWYEGFQVFQTYSAAVSWAFLRVRVVPTGTVDTTAVNSPLTAVQRQYMNYIADLPIHFGLKPGLPTNLYVT